MDERKRGKKENGNKEVRNYQPSDYEKSDDQSKGLAVTHEQVSDTFTEGTIDGKIDKVDEEGNLISHEGENLTKKGE
ncbi:YozQ family protein [Salipaludibacillus sp. HK11]|uniref:YozQ family protein n=1 Tax=Salipaludibacillus sp. HK11 TaxID=3394320 RepID=UPI0039FCDA8D